MLGEFSLRNEGPIPTSFGASAADKGKNIIFVNTDPFTITPPSNDNDELATPRSVAGKHHASPLIMDDAVEFPAAKRPRRENGAATEKPPTSSRLFAPFRVCLCIFDQGHYLPLTWPSCRPSVSSPQPMSPLRLSPWGRPRSKSRPPLAMSCRRTTCGEA